MDTDPAAPFRAATTAIRAGRGADRPGEPLNVPPVLASSFRAGTARIYSRNEGSPTIDAFEEVIGGLERGTAVAFASGMAAIAAALDHVPLGGRLTIPEVCYQGTAALADHLVRTRGVTLHRLAQDDLDGWLAALASSDVVMLESPNNPLLRLSDLPAICRADAPRRAVVVVDSTMATPVLQQPLMLGADLVVHSATKAIGGHADLLLGVVVARDEPHVTALRTYRSVYGATPGALETFLATRGVRTLPLRMRQAQANALELADRLDRHPSVTVVHYPGLVSHPDHALATTAMSGYGATLSFELLGDATTADGVCTELALIVHATSLGGIETTIERRAAIPGQEHMPPTLLRLAVGCEDVEDLWEDLAAAIGHPEARGGR